MSETPKIPAGLDPTRALETPGAGSRGRPAPGARPGNPAFEVLLENLSTRAAELEQRARTFSAPAELAGAVDVARASLEEAESLGQSLLEAFRVAQQATQADQGSEDTGPARPPKP